MWLDLREPLIMLPPRLSHIRENAVAIIQTLTPEQCTLCNEANSKLARISDVIADNTQSDTRTLAPPSESGTYSDFTIELSGFV